MDREEEFLSSVLSERGTSALPYTEDTKILIREHLLLLTSNFPSLEFNTETFIHNDGQSVNLLQVNGTIPAIIPFQGTPNNIPVIIWLMETYPRDMPCIFVIPSRDKIIVSSHKNVAPSGLVSVPYLENWMYPISNLLDLVRALTSIFTLYPPLVSRPNPRPIPPPATRPHADVVATRKARESEMGVLRQRENNRLKELKEEEIINRLKELEEEKERLEQQLQGLGRVNYKGKKVLRDVDVDVDMDSLSMQLLKCKAADLAIEDVVYSLEKVAQEGEMPFDQYMRTVRVLSRKQFIYRATAAKVKAAQTQAQVANMTTRMSNHVNI